MHRPALFASLAVTAAASLPHLVDPARVAADWNRAIEEAHQPILTPGPLGLTASRPGSPTFHSEPTPPDLVFRLHPLHRSETDAQAPAKENNRDVLVVPGGLDPKILHQVSGDMDPKILHGGADKKPPAAELFQPVDPRLRVPTNTPSEPVAPESK